MTKERLDKIASDYLNDCESESDMLDVFEVAKKALEQEPCENAISRNDMLDAVGHGTTYTSEEVQGIIKGMLPVTPKPKIGHWIIKEGRE